MRVYEAIVKGLESVGVDAMFGGAGENSASLLLALKHSSKIRPVVVRHEQAASLRQCIEPDQRQMRHPGVDDDGVGRLVRTERKAVGGCDGRLRPCR